MLLSVPETWGSTFNFRLLNTINSPAFAHENLCKEIGYDGLAILNSPEAFKYALELTAPNRTSNSGSGAIRIAIGLFYNKAARDVRWADGTPYAADFPFNNPPPDKSGNLPYGRIKENGKVIMTKNSFKALSLCGIYTSKESKGRTRTQQQPDAQTSSLAVRQTSSFLECTVFCGTDGRCRAAEFNKKLSSCKTFESGMFSGFSANIDTTTFVRDGYD
ncbi:hypothetical protein ElyMa_006632100 [Elysia marginata]|uniref:C-type lectin domain-containing protein n=1 Tax=Elysia marginata TaxID=1093978 RepID=A0AAV4IHQ5_9GAST|nr:hypothetical protein ElyMa_006632100 [Elysia marginata]